MICKTEGTEENLHTVSRVSLWGMTTHAGEDKRGFALPGFPGEQTQVSSDLARCRVPEPKAAAGR